MRQGTRVDVTVSRVVGCTEHILRVEEREEFECLVSADHLQGKPEGLGAAREPGKLLHAVARGD